MKYVTRFLLSSAMVFGFATHAAAQITTTTAPTPTLAVAAPPIPKGNHFECYNVKMAETFQPRDVRLTDQFGTRTVRVRGISRLCNPVKKMHGNATADIVDRRYHLVCYQIAQSSAANKRVRVTNQFGAATLSVYDPTELCLPSSKTVIQ